MRCSQKGKEGDRRKEGSEDKGNTRDYDCSNIRFGASVRSFHVSVHLPSLPVFPVYVKWSSTLADQQ